MRRIPIVYRRNPSGLLGKQWDGRKVQDQQTGHWTYEQYIVTDDYGVKVDSRGNGFDYNEGQPTPGPNVNNPASGDAYED